VKSSGIIHENMWGPLTFSSDLSLTNPYEMWLCIRKQFERSGVFVQETV